MLATTVLHDYAVNQACFAQDAVNGVGSNSLVHGDADSLNVHYSETRFFVLPLPFCRVFTASMALSAMTLTATDLLRATDVGTGA